MKTTIAIVDDHELVAQALSGLIQRYEEYEVIYEVNNGKELIRSIQLNRVPDIVLLDINMPEMNGYETALWLKKNYPIVKVVALSMHNEEDAVIKMLRNGACAYLLKGCKPRELKQTLDEVVQKGRSYNEFVTEKLVKSLNPETPQNPQELLGIIDREMEFIKWACDGDLTYTDIADKMCVSPRTVDGYRESVFQKMKVKTRVGMVVEAIRIKLVVL
jgi:two-component system, NarL family, invasion response regulator UvrY